MRQKITIIGSSGLVGSHFLEEINSDDFFNIKAIVRRRISNLENKNYIKQVLYDFSDLEKMRNVLNSDVLISTLGTTMKKAGSKNNFMKIDYNLPLKISEIAKEEGCRKMILISSAGANSNSKIFYSHVKGLLEDSIANIGFEEFHILRPSLLMGKRIEDRQAEYFFKIFLAPLSCLIPWQYKPIHANLLAKNIKFLIRENILGKHIWEGKKLFEIQKFQKY